MTRRSRDKGASERHLPTGIRQTRLTTEERTQKRKPERPEREGTATTRKTDGRQKRKTTRKKEPVKGE